jgi:hypothetical protein
MWSQIVIFFVDAYEIETILHTYDDMCRNMGAVCRNIGTVIIMKA